MFCKKCGSSVSEGASFCPKCGVKIERTAQKNTDVSSGITFTSLEPGTGLNGQYVQQSQDKKSGYKLTKDQQKLFLMIGIGVAVVALIAVIVALFLSRRASGDETVEEYSVVGEWHSRDMIALGEVLQNRLVEQGDNQVISTIVAAMLGNATGEVNLTFTNSGNVYIGIDNVLVSIGEFTYEDLGNNRMLLQWKADISVLGTGVPIAVAYRANYQVTEDTLELDLFGYDAVFDKAE